MCIIVRDDASTVEACLQSVRPHVDELVVVDTGSSDGSQDIVRRYADRFEAYTGCNDESGLIRSFSDARNRTLALATNDWISWADADDVVRGAERLRSLADSRQDGLPVVFMLPYEYARDGSGSVVCLQYRERLAFPRSCFSWTGDVHEHMVCDRPCLTVVDDTVVYDHRRQYSAKDREPGRNLRILMASLEKHGDDPRLLFYIGRELWTSGREREAVGFLQKCASLSSWDEEKYQACALVASILTSLGDPHGSVEWSYRAASIVPDWPLAYFEMARAYYHLAKSGKDPAKNWDRCVHSSRVCLSLPPPSSMLFVDPTIQSVEVHRYLSVALYELGMPKESLESVRSALTHAPRDRRLMSDERVIDKAILIGSVRASVLEMASKGYLTPSQASDSLTAVMGSPAPAPAPPRDGGLSVSVYVGASLEPWNPDTWRLTGLGGSETAVVEMCSRLSRLGHSVTVFGQCPEGYEGVFDGVAYADHSRFAAHDCDVLLTSRRPEAVDFGVRAKATVCWVHDVHCGDRLTPERSALIDRFLCLSEWHRDYFLSTYPFLDGGSVTVTRNGIDLERFPVSLGRNPSRVVYSSSPDRGLKSLLAVWPSVRSAVPDAELHVFYGFENWEASAGHSQRAEIDALKRSLFALAGDGVVHHGRVSQSVLAQLFLCSGVWAYPTCFSETSCISAMEAQAAGMAVVTSPVAALSETVGPRGTMVSGEWDSPGYRERFASAVVQAMSASEESRSDVRDYAFSNFGWDSLAAEWDPMLRSLVR